MNKLIIIGIVVLLGAGVFCFFNYHQGSSSTVVVDTVDIVQMEVQIVGTWQSVDDEKSVIVFEAGGVARDIYDGEELSVDTWTLRVEEGDDAIIMSRVSGADTLNYAVWSLNEVELVLNYKARGNTLVYKRIVSEE